MQTVKYLKTTRTITSLQPEDQSFLSHNIMFTCTLLSSFWHTNGHKKLDVATYNKVYLKPSFNSQINDCRIQIFRNLSTLRAYISVVTLVWCGRICISSAIVTSCTQTSRFSLTYYTTVMSSQASTAVH